VCCIASRTPGRILPAAHPQIEFTTTIVVPGCASAASTSDALRTSFSPARVSSSRIGITIISGYIPFPLLRPPLRRRKQYESCKDSFFFDCTGLSSRAATCTHRSRFPHK
jgi:hypothetical protein